MAGRGDGLMEGELHGVVAQVRRMALSVTEGIPRLVGPRFIVGLPVGRMSTEYGS